MSALNNNNTILFQAPQISSVIIFGRQNHESSSFLSMQRASVGRMKPGFGMYSVRHNHDTSQLPLQQLLIRLKIVLPQCFSLLHITTSKRFMFKGHPISYSIVIPCTLPPSLDPSPSFSHACATLSAPQPAPSMLPQCCCWDF